MASMDIDHLRRRRCGHEHCRLSASMTLTQAVAGTDGPCGRFWLNPEVHEMAGNFRLSRYSGFIRRRVTDLARTEQLVTDARHLADCAGRPHHLRRISHSAIPAAAAKRGYKFHKPKALRRSSRIGKPWPILLFWSTAPLHHRQISGSGAFEHAAQ
jgi:hypothetical protein